MKTRIGLINLFIAISAVAWPQQFSRLILALEPLPASIRQAKADSFMMFNRMFPFTESDTVCYFIYKGTANAVSVAGDFTGWEPGRDTMANITGTDLWYCRKTFEPDARLDYKFVVNRENWMLDPGNPNTCKTGFGVNSELKMPKYVTPPETMYDPSIPPGRVKEMTVASTLLGNSRTIKVYLPARYKPQGTRYPVIVFHDGLEFISLGGACIVLDNLTASGKIRPVIGIFIPPVDREPEYAEGKRDLYARFITEELMPVIDKEYYTDTAASGRASIGISNGGNAALWLTVNHPEKFGKVAAMSSNVIPEISRKVAASPKMDIEIYLDMGTYDIPVLIPMVDDFARLLKNKGYTFTYYKWHEGHSWGNWKGHLGVALKQFFPN